MLFKNAKNSSKSRRITTLKVVMALVLFIALSDKTLLQNFVGNIYGGTPNFLSAERFVHDIVNISRVINTSFALTIGVSVIITEIALVLGIAFAVYYGIKSICVRLVRQESSLEYQNVHSVVYATNDIYLKTSKFIC